jgi:pilus assembly protein CpaB
MDRRKILLIVAAVVAALGTLIVVLYVRGADARADQRYDAVQVLRAVKPIAAGETVEAAQAAGKIESGTVARSDLLPDALTGLEPVAGKVANTAIQPGEQIVSSKFGAAGAGTALAVPKGFIAISIQLDDTARVAGFLKPGDKVAVFLNGTDPKGGPYTRLLLPSVQVAAAGTTTQTTAATTDATGAPAASTLPSALLTLAVSQKDAEKVLFAQGAGSLSFGLLNADSQVSLTDGVTTANLFR